MSKQQQQTTTGGVGTLGVVQIVFIILKLIGVINWSWWLILIPVWIMIGFGFLALIVGLLFIAATK